MTRDNPAVGKKFPRLLIAGISAVVVVAAAAAGMAWLATMPPAWFRMDFAPDASMEQRSADFEQGLAAQFTKVRGEDRVWAIRIRENDMNEWLASRLPKWLEHEQPESSKKFSKVQVRCLADRVAIAAENSWGVGSVEIAPSIQAGSGGESLNLSATSAALGRLWIPSWVVATFQPTDLFNSLRNSEFRLADGRRVKVKDVEVLPGEIRLQLDTSPTKN